MIDSREMTIKLAECYQLDDYSNYEEDPWDVNDVRNLSIPDIVDKICAQLLGSPMSHMAINHQSVGELETRLNTEKTTAFPHEGRLVVRNHVRSYPTAVVCWIVPEKCDKCDEKASIIVYDHLSPNILNLCEFHHRIAVLSRAIEAREEAE